MGKLSGIAELLPFHNEGQWHYLSRLSAESGVDLRVVNSAAVKSALCAYQTLPLDISDERFGNFAAIAGYFKNSPELWIRNFVRWCPRCVEDKSGIGSVGWELFFSDACQVHECWLSSTCVCGARIHKTSLSIDRCGKCYAKFGAVVTAAAPRAIVELSRLLIKKVGSPRSSIKADDPCSPAELSVDDLQRLVSVIGRFGDPKCPPRPTGVSNFALMEESWPITTLAAEVVMDWPGAFGRLLRWHHDVHEDGSSLRLSQRFGRFYEAIFRQLPGSSFDFVRAQFDQFLQDHWHVFYRSSRAHFRPTRNEMRWQLARVACLRVEASHSTLREMISRGEIAGEERRTATGRARLMVENKSISEWRKVHIPMVHGLREAAAMLGLKRTRLRKVIHEILPLSWKPVVDRWRVPVKPIKRLLTVVDSPIVSTFDRKTHASIDHALRALRLSDQALIYIVKRVIETDGKCAFARMEREVGIAAWILTRDFIAAAEREVCVTLSAEHTRPLTVPELAKRLGVKQEVAYYLVNNGVVSVLPRNDDRCRGRRVRAADVQRFEQDFVSARELALRAGTSPKKVIDKLEREEIRPLQVSGGGICRQAFFRRAELRKGSFAM